MNSQSDTSLITLLYRHHKKAAPTHKLTSLYLIDAIARAARSKYKKEGKAKQQEEPTTTPKDQPPVSESSAGTGTCGSFLKKLEGLLSKIVLDVWENAPVEHRVSFPSFLSFSRSCSLLRYLRLFLSLLLALTLLRSS